MGKPISKGLKQLMGVGAIEAVAESERIQDIRKLKERYWSLRRSIDKQEKDLETMRTRNSLNILLGHDQSTSDIDKLRAEINNEKDELRTITEKLEEREVHLNHAERIQPVVEKREDKKDLFDMEFDTRNLFDIGEIDLPEFEEIEEDIDDIPDAEEITPSLYQLPEHDEDGPYLESGSDEISSKPGKDKIDPVRPIAVSRRRIKRVVKVRKRKVISSKINDIICTANRFEQEGLIDIAIATLENKLPSHDHHEEMLYQLGNLHFKNGDVDEAERFYRWAIEKNSHSFRSLNNLGILLQKDGRLKKAIRSFNRALEINGKYERAWYNLGSIFMEIDPPMFEEAAIFMRRALECDPLYEKAKGKLEICNEMLV